MSNGSSHDFFLNRWGRSAFGQLFARLPERVRLYGYYQLLVSTDFPEVLHIESTNACNAKCIMCPRDEMTRRIGIMSMELFKKIMDEAATKPQVKEIHLHGFGEAPIDKNLVKKLEYAKQKGIRKTYFVTTANLLTEEISKGLILGGLDGIKFSFYGATKETYERIHQRLDFDTTVRNVEAFFRVRRSLGRKNPRVTFQFVPQKENLEEKDLIVSKWQPYFDPEIGDHFEDFNLHNWIDGRSYNPLSFSNRFRKTCSHPFRLIQIHWNGDVAPCVYDFDGTIKLGNLAQPDQTLYKIWNSPAYRRLRQIHRRRIYEREPTCNKCDQLRVPTQEGSWKLETGEISVEGLKQKEEVTVGAG